MRARSGLLALVLAVVAVRPVAAQGWDVPSFFAPRPHDDVGAYLVNPEGGDLGFAAIWRQSGNINLGVRGGIGGSSGNRLWMLGAELYGPLSMLAPGTPLLIAWNTGIGATFAEGLTVLRIPLGASVGLQLGGDTGGFTIVPYAHPRAFFELRAIEVDNEEQTDTDIDFDLDLGADVQIGERWIVRGGVSLIDGTTVGFGIAYRIPRPISIR
jgi:hypothetical protein